MFEWYKHPRYDEAYTCYIGLFMLRVVRKQRTKTSHHWLGSLYYCAPYAQGQYNEMIGFSVQSKVSLDDAKAQLENTTLQLIKTFPTN